MTVVNLLISSIYAPEGCYKSALLLTATEHVRNGPVLTQEVCFLKCVQHPRVLRVEQAHGQ